MASRLLRVALTGGIATGKSYCAGRFAAWGTPVISADALARDAVGPGAPALAEIEERFGRELVVGGQLDRAALGRLVFADPAARADLEAIIHPKVYAAIEAWFEGWDRAVANSSSSTVRFAVADVPLLYETGRHRDFDRVVVAKCHPEQQQARLRERDGLSAEDARVRIASQMPLKEKVRLADFVIDTSDSVEDTDRRTREVWAALQEGDGSVFHRSR